MYNLKYRDKYGEMVLACDSTSWRTKTYPEYKASRRLEREKKDADSSSFNWSDIFAIINTVTDELNEYSPYKVLRVDGAEADDIIATLVHETQEFGKNEPVIIISGDKDFIQLHQYKNVSQFSPVLKKQVTNSNPKRYLFEHICKGDSADGIPNILSADDVFVSSVRQTPLRKKRIDEWYLAHDEMQDMTQVMDANTFRNYIRNKTMIDLQYIPKDIVSNIKQEWESASEKNNSKMLNYLISKRCANLVPCVDEFFIKK